MTNFEKIKNMSIDEMADKLEDLTVCGYCPVEKFCDKNGKTHYIRCKSTWKKWLKSEIKDKNSQ